MIDKVKYDSFSDQEIVKALLAKDREVTSYFLYQKSYPLFKHLFDKYYTDCDSCIELANQVYMILMYPQKNGKCKLESFGFKSSLNTWVGVVAKNYCYASFKVRVETFPDTSNANNKSGSDRLEPKGGSIDIDMNRINKSDIKTILDLMPNKRYRSIIEMRYLQEKDNEETAKALGMSMENYYNKHKLAKAQFTAILEKEGKL